MAVELRGITRNLDNTTRTERAQRGGALKQYRFLVFFLRFADFVSDLLTRKNWYSPKKPVL